MLESLKTDRRSEVSNGNLINIKIAENLSEIRQRFVLKLLKGNLHCADELHTRAEMLRIPQKGYCYCAIVITVVDLLDPITENALLCMCRDELSRVVADTGIHIFCSVDEEDKLVCVAAAEQQIDVNSLSEMLLSCINRIGSETDCKLICAVGPVVDKLELVAESYTFAHSEIEQAEMLAERSGVLNRDQEFGPIQIRLLTLFRNADIDGITRAVNEHVKSLHMEAAGRQILVERFIVLYLQNITNECMRLGVTLERFESYVPAVVALMQRDSAGSVDAVIQLTDQILKYLSVHRTTEGNHLLNMAKDYILANIGNERLDLATVSDHVGLSRVYFCKLFHQMEGISFSAYLKKVRIDKAKQLLLTTNLKVYEVSNAVGFSHAKYFGHVFKQTVGQTPAEYQRSAREG